MTVGALVHPTAALLEGARLHPTAALLEGARIAAEAETWQGVPFKWQGRVRAGCDCKGLIAGVAAACGRPEADSLHALAGGYQFKVPVGALLAGLAELFDRAREVMPGDVLVLFVGGKPQHLAIAAPTPARPSRAIQAVHTGPLQVVACGVPRATIHSIWRWRSSPLRPTAALLEA